MGKRNATEDMKRMQEEAIRRVKEMHARSKPGAPPTVQAAHEKAENTPQKPHFTQKRNSNFNLRKTRLIKNLSSLGNTNFQSQSKKSSSDNIFGNLPSFMDLIFKDSDKSLLIVLIILLMDDEENFMILLVLFYLLL